MIRRWLALTYYLYALRLAALSHFYFNPLYFLACRLLFSFGYELRKCFQTGSQVGGSSGQMPTIAPLYPPSWWKSLPRLASKP